MLESIRSRAQLRLEDIADALDVSISTVQRWEKGTMNIPSGRFGEIALAYGCRVNEIIIDDEQRDDPASKIVGLFETVPDEQRDLALRLTLNTLEQFQGDDKRRTG